MKTTEHVCSVSQSDETATWARWTDSGISQGKYSAPSLLNIPTSSLEIEDVNIFIEAQCDEVVHAGACQNSSSKDRKYSLIISYHVCIVFTFPGPGPGPRPQSGGKGPATLLVTLLPYYYHIFNSSFSPMSIRTIFANNWVPKMMSSSSSKSSWGS